MRAAYHSLGVEQSQGRTGGQARLLRALTASTLRTDYGRENVACGHQRARRLLHATRRILRANLTFEDVDGCYSVLLL
eukprot:1903815-Rhodomonas_salina.1